MKLAKGGRGALVLVCGKCSKKLGGGFGKKRKTSLAKALRTVDGFGKGRKSAVQVTETKCLGLCPKGAVIVVDACDPLKWLVVERGEDVAVVAARLRGRQSAGCSQLSASAAKAGAQLRGADGEAMRSSTITSDTGPRPSPGRRNT